MSHHNNSRINQLIARQTKQAPATSIEILKVIQPVEEIKPREQRLMRCGLNFYRVYADDGTLVDPPIAPR